MTEFQPYLWLVCLIQNKLNHVYGELSQDPPFPTTHEDSTNSQNGRSIVSGLQSVKCEEQLQEKQAILPSVNTDLASTWTSDVNELTAAKPENGVDIGEYERVSDETRHRVVCPGGVLKEVKAEHTRDV